MFETTYFVEGKKYMLWFEKAISDEQSKIVEAKIKELNIDAVVVSNCLKPYIIEFDVVTKGEK